MSDDVPMDAVVNLLAEGFIWNRFVAIPSEPIRLPDGFMAVDREELVTLLKVVLERGITLGMADFEYREWLESLEEEDEDGTR